MGLAAIWRRDIFTGMWGRCRGRAGECLGPVERGVLDFCTEQLLGACTCPAMLCTGLDFRFSGRFHIWTPILHTGFQENLKYVRAIRTGIRTTFRSGERLISILLNSVDITVLWYGGCARVCQIMLCAAMPPGNMTVLPPRNAIR